MPKAVPTVAHWHGRSKEILRECVIARQVGNRYDERLFSMSTSFAVAGKQVRCAHCNHTEFDRREILLNTRGASLINLDWLNRAAVTLTCKKCSRIEWFNDEPETLD